MVVVVSVFFFFLWLWLICKHVRSPPSQRQMNKTITVEWLTVVFCLGGSAEECHQNVKAVCDITALRWSACRAWRDTKIKLHPPTHTHTLCLPHFAYRCRVAAMQSIMGGRLEFSEGVAPGVPVRHRSFSVQTNQWRSNTRQTFPPGLWTLTKSSYSRLTHCDIKDVIEITGLDLEYQRRRKKYRWTKRFFLCDNKWERARSDMCFPVFDPPSSQEQWVCVMNYISYWLWAQLQLSAGGLERLTPYRYWQSNPAPKSATFKWCKCAFHPCFLIMCDWTLMVCEGKLVM